MKFGLKPGLVKRRKMIKGRSLKVMAWGMVLSVFLSTPAFALTSAFSSRYEIGENTVYYAVDGENSSGLQKVNYVEYQPNSGVSPIIAYGNNLYGRSTITRITELLESQGKEVIAGINADFFDLTTGIPIGIVVQDGVFISSNTGQYAVGFKADGSAVIGKPVASMTLSSDAGNMVVDCFNKARSTYTTCMFDRNFSDTTKVSTEGTSIIFERLDDEEVRLNSSIRLRVVSKQTGSTPISIGENQMVLSVSAKGPLERIPNIAVGDEVTFSVTTTDSDWQDVVYAVGGKSLIENGTVDTTGSPTGLNPRSAVGVKADGTVVLYEVDGRQSGFSVGMSPSSLAQELLNLGCVDAINLDGGGSSAMVIQYPGETDAEVINSPSDGSLRTCANYIFLVNNGSKTGNVAHLHIYPETQYALPGASVPLTIKATDEHYYPVTAPSDVTYQVSDNNGSFSGNAYIAGDTKGGVTITAKSGSATGSQYIYIISAVDGLSITKDGSSTALSSLSVQGGSSTTLAVKGTYKGNAVAVGNTSVQWSVSGNIGTVKDGVFTASNQGGSGKLTVSYNGYTKTIPVTVSTTIGEAAQTQLLADFESELDFRMTTDGNIALATDYDSVYRGKGSLKMAYDFSNATSNGIIAAEDLEIDSGMQYLHLWVKGDGSGCTLIANFENSEGEKLTATVAQNIKSQDYQHHSVSIPSGAVKFTGLTVQQGSQSKGILYFDQILCSAGSNGDSTAPTVSFQSVPSTASVNGSASIVAKVTDNNGQQNLNDSQILVTVDGKTTAFTSNKTTGNIAFTAANLKAGIHRVTVVATDDFGNIGRASASIQVGSANTAGFTDISDHWAKEYINFVAERGVVNGETLKDGSSRFFPKRNLTRAEFAVMIARFLGLDTEQEVSLPYADASSIPSWALGAVKAVYAEGIMTGSIENGRTYFHPTTNIVRQEVMTVISKALPQGYAVRNQNFSDASQISDWALPHINKLVSLNIVNGYEDGTILPRQYITRAEVAKLIYTLY